MTIALLAALFVGEFFTALIIAVFVLGAEVLEGLTVGRGRRAIRDLLDFLPATATVRRSTGSVRVPLEQVRIGDAVLVAPGECIAVDGTVRGGHSFVDQATITGESQPVEKSPGAVVYAGTINQSGVLDILAERLGRDTSFGKIVDAVESAERSRAPVQRTADRYAGYLVYFALGCAALTFAITRDARSTISVIIVAGACGIAAGTPLAVLGAIGLAARAGAIIKGGRYLEALWTVDTVAFDKTGTVTIGSPHVLEIRPVAGVCGTRGARGCGDCRTTLRAPPRHGHRAASGCARSGNHRTDTFSYTPGRGIVATLSNEAILVGNRAFVADHGVSLEGLPCGRGVDDRHRDPRRARWQAPRRRSCRRPDPRRSRRGDASAPRSRHPNGPADGRRTGCRAMRWGPSWVSTGFTRSCCRSRRSTWWRSWRTRGERSRWSGTA